LTDENHFSKNNSVKKKETKLLWTIFLILCVLWFLGLFTGYTLGGLIHVLLVVAIIVLLVRIIQGRKVL
jgi:fatty-acid desaturase